MAVLENEREGFRRLRARYALTTARRSHRSDVSVNHGGCWLLSERDRHGVPHERTFTTIDRTFTTYDQQRVRTSRLSARRRQMPLLGAVRYESTTPTSAEQLCGSWRIVRSAGHRVSRQHCRNDLQRGLQLQVYCTQHLQITITSPVFRDVFRQLATAPPPYEGGKIFVQIFNVKKTMVFEQYHQYSEIPIY